MVVQERAGALDAPTGKGTERLRQRFREMDADGDGLLSKEEIGDIHLAVTDAQLDALFATADADGSGAVGFDGFARAVAAFDDAELAGLDSLDDLLPM